MIACNNSAKKSILIFRVDGFISPSSSSNGLVIEVHGCHNHGHDLKECTDYGRVKKRKTSADEELEEEGEESEEKV